MKRIVSLFALLALAAGEGTAPSASTPSRPDAVNLAEAAVPSEAGCEQTILARVAPIVEWHADRYPGLEVEDLYKLLHQAVAGPAHAIEDSAAAHEWLKREWNDLGSSHPAEEEIEPISRDGALVRVNLRPWRDAGRGPEVVLRAFLRTANAFHPDPVRIRGELDSILACRDQVAARSGIPASLIGSFFAARAAEGYPAVDHSPAYRGKYAPAYRVVLRDFLE